MIRGGRELMRRPDKAPRFWKISKQIGLPYIILCTLDTQVVK